MHYWLTKCMNKNYKINGNVSPTIPILWLWYRDGMWNIATVTTVNVVTDNVVNVATVKLANTHVATDIPLWILWYICMPYHCYMYSWLCEMYCILTAHIYMYVTFPMTKHTELTVIINDGHYCLVRAQSDTCWSIGEVHCECFIIFISPVTNNRYSDSLYSGTRSEGNAATGGVVVTSSCLDGIIKIWAAVILLPWKPIITLESRLVHTYNNHASWMYAKYCYTCTWYMCMYAQHSYAFGHVIFVIL